MRKIYYEIDVGYCGCGHEDTTTVDDDMSDGEIDQMVNDLAMDWAQQWEGDERLCWDSEMSSEEYDAATDEFYSGVSGWWRWATDED